MAILRTERNSKLQIKFNTSSGGETSTATRSVGSWIWAPDLTDEQMYTAGSLYADLQTHPMVEVSRTERITLEEN